MRNLKSSDIFAACRLLNAIGVRDEFKSIAEKVNNIKELNQFDVGYDLVFNVFEKATSSKAEKEWYQFFSNIFECKAQEVEKMDAIEFFDKVLEVADVNAWRDFFSRVAKLMNVKS